MKHPPPTNNHASPPSPELSPVNRQVEFPSGPQWEFALEIVRTLQSGGWEAYLVGGCVRDILLGIEPGDYDIATSSPPRNTLEIFPRADRFGIKFGVLTIRKKGCQCQVAAFRRDHPLSDGRRPQRVYYSDLSGDSSRRDFTINAIYLDPLKKKFIDPWGGIQDLEARILRIIGEPETRLKEDHLRILRAVRFASRFGLTIEPVSMSALKALAPLTTKISPDRIREEITRAFTRGDRVYALEILHITGILQILWDVFSAGGEGLYAQTMESMKESAGTSPADVWSAFFKPWQNLKNHRDLLESAMMKLNFPRKWKRVIRENLGAE